MINYECELICFHLCELNSELAFVKCECAQHHITASVLGAH